VVRPLPTPPAGDAIPNRAKFGDRYRGVRYRKDTGFEMRCFECPSGTRYWPLTPEFWDVYHGLNRCRACWLSYWRKRAIAVRLADPELSRARSRAKYRRNRRVIAIKRRAYAAANRAKINAKRRETYAKRVAA
jgi:hypothetical protein